MASQPWVVAFLAPVAVECLAQLEAPALAVFLALGVFPRARMAAAAVQVAAAR